MSYRTTLSLFGKNDDLCAFATGCHALDLQSKYAVYGKAALSWAAESGDVEEVQQQLEVSLFHC